MKRTVKIIDNRDPLPEATAIVTSLICIGSISFYSYYKADNKLA